VSRIDLRALRGCGPACAGRASPKRLSPALTPGQRRRRRRLDWYQGGEYLITDELGMPVHPEWYSDEFGRLLRRAGLRRITLHDSRHTTLTLMEHAGMPISIVST
jgi:integrase